MDQSIISYTVHEYNGNSYTFNIRDGAIDIIDTSKYEMLFSLRYSGTDHANEPYINIQSNIKMSISGSPLLLGAVSPGEIYGKEARWEVMDGRSVLVAD